MKTEQEQIEEMQEIIGDCWEFDSVSAELGNGDGYINIEEAAKALVQAGYGDVSEYKSEIERLKSNNGFLQCVISHKLHFQQFYLSFSTSLISSSIYPQNTFALINSSKGTLYGLSF